MSLLAVGMVPFSLNIPQSHQYYQCRQNKTKNTKSSYKIQTSIMVLGLGQPGNKTGKLNKIEPCSSFNECFARWWQLKYLFRFTAIAQEMIHLDSAASIFFNWLVNNHQAGFLILRGEDVMASQKNALKGE